MKIICWNVNGIRAALKKNFLAYVEREDPDVLCIQETKAGRDHIQINTPGYEQYWNNAEKPGYSGTLIFTKEKPLSVQYGLAQKEHDTEGRVITAEYKDFFLVTVYVPNAQPDLARIDYRMQWDKDFCTFLKKLDKKKPVIVCGDFNVAHNAIDLARPKQNEGKKGFSQQERDGFQRFIDANFIDTFRHVHGEKIQYSWWSMMGGARKNNVGWRIDYFLISKKLASRLKDAFIQDQVMGSDHCPVGIVLK